MPWSFLEPTLQTALELVAEDDRKTAAKIAVLGEMGYADMEIVKEVGLSWRAMNRVRLSLQGGLILSMRDNGYSDPEIVRTLGITVGSMASAVGAVAPNCLAA